MTRITDISGLEALREKILDNRIKDRTILRTCISTGCKAQKSLKVVEALKAAIKEQGIEDKVEIKKTGCHGFCEMGPIMVVEPENIFYRKVKPEDVGEILSTLNRIIER